MSTTTKAIASVFSASLLAMAVVSLASALNNVTYSRDEPLKARIATLSTTAAPAHFLTAIMFTVIAAAAGLAVSLLVAKKLDR